MYKEKISRYIDAHRKEMLEDIGALCRINSVKGSYRIGKPYGEGCSEALLRNATVLPSTTMTTMLEPLI